MAAEATVVRSGGVGLGTVLFLIFLVLKLTGHISWSWWWVTAPLWIPFGVVGAIIGFSLIVLLICAATGKLEH